MTLAAVKARGYATAVKGSLGWQAVCTVCDWHHIITGFAYKSDAATAARDHNAQIHGVKR